MKKLFSVILVTALVACSTKSSNDAHTIESLRGPGGKAFFRELVANGAYDRMLVEISNGNDYLIRHAPTIGRYADASTHLGLMFALSKGLVHNPEAVLSLLPQDLFDTQQICTVPFIEGSEAVALDHIFASIEALENMPDQDAYPAFSQCLKIYEELKVALSQSK